MLAQFVSVSVCFCMTICLSFFLSVSLCASICNSDVSLGLREYIGLSVCLYVCEFLDMHDWISQCTEYAYASRSWSHSL